MRALYITYDGLTDNLGSAQIVPYLLGLARAGHEIVVLSCEKPARSGRRQRIAEELSRAGIDWRPIRYHKKPPILSTLFDIAQMYRAARRIHRERPVEAVHCRSYVPALVGLKLKKKLGIKLIFDMRGFWADERVDGGLWSLGNPLYKLIYSFFKRKESDLLRSANSVISLTERAKQEMATWPVFRAGADLSVVKVIPCCADLEHFRPREGNRSVTRRELKIAEDDLVFVYLGSLGTWYMLREMLAFFKSAKKRYTNAKFLVLTPDSPEEVHAVARGMGLDCDAIIVRAADRKDVPVLLAGADIGLFFIRPSYSKLSSSATKLGEMLSMGLPVIANAGVGDHEIIFSKHDVGHLVKKFHAFEYDRAVDSVPRLMALDPLRIRASAEASFSLANGIEKYLEIYSSLDSRADARNIGGA